MNLAELLPGEVSMLHEDFEWTQTVDYEHTPFRCRKCHQHGHLFRDFPLNKKVMAKKESNDQEAEGFTKVASIKRPNKRATPSQNKKGPVTSNNFTTLN